MRRNRTRRKTGVGALEVAISAGLMIIIVALAVDLTILNYAFTINDAACRDAARAMAAQASPTATSNPGNPVGAAKAACRMHQTDGVFISQPALRTTSLANTIGSDLVYENTLLGAGTIPSGQTARVACTTFVDVALPIPLVFWGNNMLSNNGGKIRFVRRYIFPVINQSVK